jgi:hypothetical protein
MRSSGEIEDRADFCWKRAVAVRALASTMSAAESKAALLRMADEYERMAEELTRVMLLGDNTHTDASGRFIAH